MENIMKVIVCDSYASQSAAGADIIEEIVRSKPDCCLGLATGSSPVGMYQELARRCKEEGLDFSQVHTVNLDEYIGLEPTHDQSYRHFMNTNLFDHINIDKANTYVAKGTGDVDANIQEFRRVIAQSEVELQVLGVGADGHLAFNEPGENLYWSAHRETLDESTIDANARFFASRDEVPRYAVTMGIGEIMMAKRLLMILSGSNKEHAARMLLTSDEVTTHCPATLMKLHRDATVIITQDLADKIGYKA
jgi:glucosamine-6-phosphate deaminase